MRTSRMSAARGMSRRVALLSVFVLTVTTGLVWCVEAGQRGGGGQQQRGGQGGASSAPPAEAASGQVRVPTSWANIHAGPTTGNELIVVVPKGTVLTVTGRDKEWIQVQLTPELRKTSMVMRWYNNEQRGWMHDSTVRVESGGSGRSGR